MSDFIREDIKIRLKNAFQKQFGTQDMDFISAPGRVELIGNHTDHQRGKVLAASVDLKAYAAFAPNGTDLVNIVSEGHSADQIRLNDLMPDVSEFGSTKAIIKGVLHGFYNKYKAEELRGEGLKGFDAYIISEVLTGSGLSSSAAFEVLLGRIINTLCFEGSASPIEIAKIGQTAENRFFGKPCGLMDQAASSIGNVVFFNFEDPEDPSTEQIEFDFQKAGYALCAVACGAGHADLTEEYARIPKDMGDVARLFGKTVLQEVPEEEVRKNETMITEKLGARPFLRAIHFYEESFRAEEAALALKKGDMNRFLDLANASGISSRTKLANIIPESKPEENKLDIAMRLAVALLGGKQEDGSEGSGMKGAVRMNGGGFSGTFLSIVPLEELPAFKKDIEERLGDGSCMVLNT